MTARANDNAAGDVRRAREVLARARSLLVLTGAGISAESGVPTFRGGAGAAIWRGMPFEQLSSAEMLERNLPLVWEWFDYRRSVVRKCRPNPAHLALAHWEAERRFQRFTLVTQNVDGLHSAAGSTDPIELHGNIWRARCNNCGDGKDLSDMPETERPPVCSRCANFMRPDVVLFGEMLPVGAFERAVTEARNCDACLVIGTSALVYPAAALPEIAHDAGAFVIEVNPEQTTFSDRCDLSLRERAGEIVPLLMD